jgi:DNA polymerase-3 subunit alpha
LPPDVNFSNNDFTPIYEEAGGTKGRKDRGTKGGKSHSSQGVIRFGLAAVRGVGEKAVEAIIAERRERGAFKSIFDFTERVDCRTVQRSTMEALVKCGAFSSLKAKRAQLLAVLDRAFEMGQQSQQDKRMGQMSMFGAAASAGSRVVPDSLPDVEELPDAELLKFEKELLGFYISSHPLTRHEAALQNFSTASTKEAMSCSEGTEITIGGMINRVKKSVTKNGRPAGMTMAMITLEDLEGQIDAVLFAETLADVLKKYPDCIAAEQIVFLRGRVDRRRETPNIIVSDAIPMEDAVTKLTTSLGLKLDPLRHSSATAGELDPLLKRYKGNTEVYVQIAAPSGQRVIMRLDRERFVKTSLQLKQDLERLLGTDSVQFSGAGTRRRKRAVQEPLFKEEPIEAEPAPEPAEMGAEE